MHCFYSPRKEKYSRTLFIARRTFHHNARLGKRTQQSPNVTTAINDSTDNQCPDKERIAVVGLCSFIHLSGQFMPYRHVRCRFVDPLLSGTSASKSGYSLRQRLIKLNLTADAWSQAGNPEITGIQSGMVGPQEKEKTALWYS